MKLLLPRRCQVEHQQGQPLRVAAMEAEAAPLILGLGLYKDEPQRIAPPAPCVSYSGQCHGATITVVCNGEDTAPLLELAELGSRSL